MPLNVYSQAAMNISQQKRNGTFDHLKKKGIRVCNFIPAHLIRQSMYFISYLYIYRCHYYSDIMFLLIGRQEKLV